MGAQADERPGAVPGFRAAAIRGEVRRESGGLLRELRQGSQGSLGARVQVRGGRRIDGGNAGRSRPASELIRISLARTVSRNAYRNTLKQINIKPTIAAKKKKKKKKKKKPPPPPKKKKKKKKKKS